MVGMGERDNASTTFIDANLEAERGDRVAIRCGGTAHTYRQVSAMVCRMGHALRSLGVRREERVALALPDSPDFVAGFFGAMRIGAVPVPLNTRLHGPEYRYMLGDCRARVLVAHETAMPAIRPQRADLQHLEHVVVVGRADDDEVDAQALLARQPDTLDPIDTHRDEPGFWLYSSGSTGFPKGVVHRHHDLVHCADHYARNVLSLDQDDRTLSAAKLFFAYGLGNSLYFPFRVGATCVLHPDPPKPGDLFALIETERPTVFFGVPTLYAAMLEAAADHPYDLRSLRLCVSAGEALPAELFRQWHQRFGVEILDGIGSTEMLHIYLSNRAGRVVPGSSGTPVSGYEVKILDERESAVAVGEIGNLWVKGDSCSPGYWNRRQDTLRAMRGEWFHSGDTYSQDADGVFWFRGRADDMMKVGGQWVSPVEVESALIEHPGVLEAAVVGQQDAEGLVKPKAYVVLASGRVASDALAAELEAFVAQRIAGYKRPRWIAFVESLPKTTTGKIQRFKLRDPTGRPSSDR